MSFTLRHQETGREGSFKAWGTGLYYEYNAHQQILDIIETRENRPLLFIDIEEDVPGEALLFTRYLEKATQLKALTFSNMATIDLAETLDSKKLPSIVKNITVSTSYAFDLQLLHFNRFARNFAENFLLQDIHIERIYSELDEPQLFKAHLRTEQGKAVSATDSTLPATLKKLSEQIIPELVMPQYGGSFHSSAQNLLNAASKLSTISRILNENFIPRHKLAIMNKHIHQRKAQRTN